MPELGAPLAAKGVKHTDGTAHTAYYRLQPPILRGSCPLLSRALNDRGLRFNGRGLPLSLGLEQHAVGRQQRLDVLKVHALQRRGRR